MSYNVGLVATDHVEAGASSTSQKSPGPPQARDYFDDLPDELLLLIFRLGNEDEHTWQDIGNTLNFLSDDGSDCSDGPKVNTKDQIDLCRWSP